MISWVSKITFHLRVKRGQFGSCQGRSALSCWSGVGAGVSKCYFHHPAHHEICFPLQWYCWRCRKQMDWVRNSLTPPLNGIFWTEVAWESTFQNFLRLRFDWNFHFHRQKLFINFVPPQNSLMSEFCIVSPNEPMRKQVQKLESFAPGLELVTGKVGTRATSVETSSFCFSCTAALTSFYLKLYQSRFGFSCIQ